MAIVIGSPGLFVRGAYAAGTAYNVNDVVTSGGTSYVAIAATTGNAPPNATYWTTIATAIQGVPTGGTANQAIVKTSGTDYATTWVSQAAALNVAPAWANPNMTSGLWYDTRYLSANSSGSFTLTANTAYFIPLILGTSVTISALGMWATAVSGQITLGAYTADATTGYPATLLGTVNVTPSATGTAYSSTVTATLPAGLNYLACFATATYSLGSVSSTFARPLTGFTSPPTETQAASSPYIMFVDAGTGTGLVSNPTVTAMQSNQISVIYFRVA